MPNRQVRPVQVDPFNPRVAPAESLAPVARPDGSTDEAITSDALRVSAVLNQYADEAATIEGKRAGKIAGLDPTFRPTGSTTLRGRASDEAAIETYVQSLDARVRTQLQDTYEANKDNPAGLKVALEKVHADMTAPNGDVFPEIRGKFDSHFTQLSIAYRNKAQTNADGIAADNDKAALFRNLTDVDTQTKRAIASLDPDDPAVEKLIAGSVAQQTALWKKAADNEAVTATAAELKTQGVRNSAWGDLVMARAAKLTTPAELAEFQKKFDADFAAGKYEGKLDGGGYEVVRANLGKMGKAVSTAGDQATRQLTAGFEDFIKRDAAGLTPPEGEWNSLVEAAGKIPNGDQVLALADAKRKLAATLRASSVEAGDAVIQKLRDDARAEGVHPMRASLIEFGRKFVEDERKAFTTDQLGAAARKGIIGTVAPVDFEAYGKTGDTGAANELATQIRDRVAQARAVGGSLARAPQYLRPEEKARLTEIVAEGGDKALGLAGAIVRGAGSDAPAMLKQISDDAPLLAQAGNILVNGGSVQAARDAFEANRLKGIKGARVPEPDAPTFNKTLRDDFGQAFVMQPEDQGRVRTAATAIAEARLARGGIDPKSSQAGDIYKRAAQEAAGAQFVDGVQYGGVGSYKPGWWTSYKVALPNAVRADSFRDVIRAIRDEDLPPGVKARDLVDAVPIAVRGPTGVGYRFAQGDAASSDPRYIGLNGVPFVLDFDALAPRLRMRVPGAFIGAR